MFFMINFMICVILLFFYDFSDFLMIFFYDFLK